jgi:branched-chain amino acid transport system permease protein
VATDMIATPIAYLIYSSIFLSIFSISVSLNFRISKFLNLAHASAYTFGAYLAYYTLSNNINILIGYIVTFLLSACLGIVLFAVVIKLGKNLLQATIISLGYSIALEEVLRITHPTGYYLIISQSPFTPEIREILSAILLLSILLILAILYKSSVGIKMKFTEDDRFLAEIYGVNTERFAFYAVISTFAVLSTLGFITSSSYAISPTIGWNPLVTSILISGFTSLFRLTGFSHFVTVVLITFIYSTVMYLVI